MSTSPMWARCNHSAGPSAQMTMDGVSAYPALLQNGTASRTEVLLGLDPPGTYYGQPFIGQAAFRWQQWKLIAGQVRRARRPPLTRHSPTAA